MRNLAAFKGLRFSRLGSLLASTPLAFLFASREPGVWLDPSDLTTLFQDSTGAIPVTAPGQSVGLVLDKSKGLALGLDLVTNGDFSDGLTGWADVSTAPAAISIVGGSLQLVSDGVARARARSSQATVVGRTYRVTFVVLSGTVEFNCGTTFAGIEYFGGGSFSAGTYTRLILATSNTMHIQVHKGVAGTGIAGGVSVRELSGSHAIQTTAAARPTYAVEPLGGRRNLLTFTEQFDNAAWTNSAGTVSVTANTTTAPDGTMTADKLVPAAATNWMVKRQNITLTAVSHVLSVWAKLSDAGVHLELYCSAGEGDGGAVFNLSTGAVITSANCTTTVSADDGNGWRRYAIVFTPPSAASVVDVRVTEASTRNTQMTGNGVKGILIWGAQLETGSTATNYQRVGSFFDVTEAGVPSLGYLSFDGVDDFLVTPTIAPGTDKVQVFAGVRKRTTEIGVIAEHSAITVSNNGTMMLLGNWGGRGGFRSKGTVGADANVPFSGTVETLVMTGLGDIAEDVSAIRFNGTELVRTTTDQGPGNYLAYPLYIGRRGGASLPFNGRIYGLVTRFGANLNESQIKYTESLLAQKTGVTL